MQQLATQYLHNIYNISTQYLHNIYTRCVSGGVEDLVRRLDSSSDLLQLCQAAMARAVFHGAHSSVWAAVMAEPKVEPLVFLKFEIYTLGKKLFWIHLCRKLMLRLSHFTNLWLPGADTRCLYVKSGCLSKYPSLIFVLFPL